MATSDELEQFLAERRTGIGGSDSAAIAGLDPFKTAYHVALEKQGKSPPDPVEEDDVLIFGRLSENMVAREYARRNDVKVRRMNLLVRSKEHPFLIAHYDRDIVGVPGRLEVKTSGNTFEWGPDGSDAVPARVVVQCQHYMAVEPSLEWVDVALLLQGQKYRQYRLHRRPAMIEDIIDLDQAFWMRLQAGELPLPDYEHPRTEQLIRDLYPGTNGETVTVEKIAALTTAYDIAREKRLAYEKMEDGLRTHVLYELGNAARALTEDGRVWERKMVSKKEYLVAANKYQDFRLKKLKEDK